MDKLSTRSLSPRGFYALSLCVLGAPLLLAAGSANGIAASDTPAGASAKQGAAIFQQRCIACHNKQRDDDSPFGPPNLYTAFHGQTPLSAKAAASIVTDGKGAMPSFGATLSKTQIRSVIAYLRSRQ